MLLPLPDYGTGMLPGDLYHQESDTSAFYTTWITSRHFSDGTWVIAPEPREVVSRALKADLILSKCHESIPQSPPRPNQPSTRLPSALPPRLRSPVPGSETSNLPRPIFRIIPRLAVEFKSTIGDRLEMALEQLIGTIKPRMDILDRSQEGFYYQMFFMVARGPKVAFFSYYSEIFHEFLDRLQIPHFRGCVSVTEIHDHIDHARYGRGIFLPHDIPNDLELLNLDDPMHVNVTSADLLRLRHDAAQYRTPCVFDMGTTRHRELVDKIFFYISHFSPREIPVILD